LDNGKHQFLWKSLLYNSVDSVFLRAVAGIGARIGFSYYGPVNSSFVWPRISRPPIKIRRKNFTWRNLLSSFKSWWSLPLLWFTVPPLRGRKVKPFPKFL